MTSAYSYAPKHRYLHDCTRYNSFRYSTICYGISGFLFARYNVSTVNIQSHCDGCVTAFGVTHKFSCSTGGLIIACHNKIRDKLFYLSQRAFTSASVCVKPLMHQGRTRTKLEIRQGSDKHKDMRADVMIRGLWDRQIDAIIDIKIGDADADTYNHEPMTSLLARW